MNIREVDILFFSVGPKGYKTPSHMRASSEQGIAYCPHSASDGQIEPARSARNTKTGKDRVAPGKYDRTPCPWREILLGHIWHRTSILNISLSFFAASSQLVHHQPILHHANAKS